jgi:hypothetical protein
VVLVGASPSNLKLNPKGVAKMANLIPRSNNSLANSQIPEGFSKREGAELSRLQNAEVSRGLVTGTRIAAAGYVTGIALQTTAMLSREAQFQADGDERTSARLEHIVDAFTMNASSEVSRFGQ